MDPRSQQGEVSPLLDGTTTDGAPAPVLSLGQIRPANASNDYTDGPPGVAAVGPTGPVVARTGTPRGPLPLHQQQQQHRAGSPPHKAALVGRVARSTSTGSTCSKSSSARTSTGSTCSEQRLLPPAPPSPSGPVSCPAGAPPGPPVTPDTVPTAVVKRQPQGGDVGGGGGGGTGATGATGAAGGDDVTGEGGAAAADERTAPAEKPGFSPGSEESGAARGHAACERCGKCACGECGATRRALPACWLCEKRCLCSAGALLESCTCLCCVKALFYHCSPQTDVGDSGDSWADNPCSCRRAGCVPRWACLGALSLALPCLLCYPPGRAALKLARAAYDRLQRPGCRCRRRQNDADSDRVAAAPSPAAEKPA